MDDFKYLVSNQSVESSGVLLSSNSTPGLVPVTYPRATTLFATVCCIVFIIFGISGNLVTILALSRCIKLRNATTAFVISLCTADLLFCTLNLPPTASR